jgi:hypothetical protein
MARLITVEPTPVANGDRVIASDGLRAAAGSVAPDTQAAIIRTLPNTTEKLVQDYAAQPAAYFAPEAIRWLVALGIEHLVTDLPSLDRADDGGKLAAHRVFWGMPPAATSVAESTRAHATVTELAFIPDALVDGLYLLNLQVAPFVADAAPSRPVLYPLEPAS